jgi:peptide chain release factor 1
VLSIEVEGDDLSELNHEPGGHRIQRVPPTERQGRVHSSTVTVSVLDKLVKTTVEWNNKDFKIEWYSGTGAGGQHRNKHQNSCRLTHLPTGTVVTAQCRSRENSLDEAKATILTRLSTGQARTEGATHAAVRRLQVGSGERGDKIRTYRFQDGTVKDHQTGRSAQIEKVMAGNFHLLW